MSNSDECTFTQKQFFAVRHDELSEAFADAVNTHLDECPICTRFYSRLDVMLRAARDSDPELLLRSTPDALFDHIVDAIETPSVQTLPGLDLGSVRAELRPTLGARDPHTTESAAELPGIDFDAIRDELQPSFSAKQADDLFARIEDRIAADTSGQHEAAADALFARITAEVEAAKRDDLAGETLAYSPQELKTQLQTDLAAETLLHSPDLRDELAAAPTPEPVQDEDGASNVVSFAAAAAAAETQSPQRISDELADDDDPLVAPRSYAWAGWAAIAAVIIGAIAFAMTRGSSNDDALEPQDAPGLAVTDDEALDEPGVAPPQEENAAELPDKTIGDALAGLGSSWEGDDVVRVFGDEGAEWTVTGDDDRTLALSAGTVMVEFVPEHGESLRVVTEEYTIDVVGTVFFATADTEVEVPVGVLTGGVDVTPASGDAPVRVASAQAWSRSGTISELDARSRTELEARVSPAEHAARLRASEEALAALAAAVTPQESESVREPLPEREQDSVRETSEAPEERLEEAVRDDEPSEEAQEPATPDTPLDRGRLALREGDAARAAREFERALLAADPSSALAATLHLDLARLYADRLGRPLNAAGHLRTFLDRFPDDVAADIAERELCRLVVELGQSDPRCGGGR